MTGPALERELTRPSPYFRTPERDRIILAPRASELAARVLKNAPTRAGRPRRRAVVCAKGGAE